MSKIINPTTEPSVTCGFFNSVVVDNKSDRLYNAEQMSAIFDGLINDGVFAGIGDKLVVSTSSGNTVSVGTGKCWFNHTWTLNDAPLLIDQLEDSVAQEEIDKLPEILFISYLHDLESEAIDKLTDKEKTVTKAINGFESAVYTVNEVADMLGVSYSRVQELKSNSYRKLRHNKKIKNIWATEYLYR